MRGLPNYNSAQKSSTKHDWSHTSIHIESKTGHLPQLKLGLRTSMLSGRGLKVCPLSMRRLKSLKSHAQVLPSSTEDHGTRGNGGAKCRDTQLRSPLTWLNRVDTDSSCFQLPTAGRPILLKHPAQLAAQKAIIMTQGKVWKPLNYARPATCCGWRFAPLSQPQRSLQPGFGLRQVHRN